MVGRASLTPLLCCALLASLAHAYRPKQKHPASDVTVLSIGSLARAEYQLAQQNSFGTRLHVIAITEEDVSDCVICDSTLLEDQSGATKRPEKKVEIPFYQRYPAIGPFDDKDEGWWCAQKRPLMALRSFLKEHVPNWVLVIDDDTFVNPKNLLAFIKKENQSQPALYGYTADAEWSTQTWTYLHGGAGWLINKPALEGLLQVRESQKEWKEDGWVVMGNRTYLDGCIERQNGGSWCYFHSDWAVPTCVKEMGFGDILEKGLHAAKLFDQCCLSGCGPVPEDVGALITCHYSDPKQQQYLFRKYGNSAGAAANDSTE